MITAAIIIIFAGLAGGGFVLGIKIAKAAIDNIEN